MRKKIVFENPLLKGLPQDLKDPANFERVQRALFAVLQSTHSHSEMFDWKNCFPCQQRVRDHKELMQKLGFRAPGQYPKWKKAHEMARKKALMR